MPIGRIYEDTLWIVQIIDNAKSITYIDDPLYHYLYREESLSHNIQQITKRLLDKIEMSEQRIMFLKEYYPTLVQLEFFKLQEFCYEEYILICVKYKHLDKNGELRNKLYCHFCQLGAINIKDIVGMKMKLGRIFFRICPGLFMNVYSMLYTIIHRI